MPIILSIETSSPVCSVAISENDAILAEYSIMKNNAHDKLLAELTKRILNDLELSFDKIDAVAVSAGPGSFTGLRIGAALAKGICYDNKIKLIAVPTINSLFYQALKNSHLINYQKYQVIAISHNNFVFSQYFDSLGNELADIEYQKLNEALRIVRDDCMIIIANNEDRIIDLRNYISIQISAKNLVDLAYRYFLEGKFTDPEIFVPNYKQDFKFKSES